MPMTTGSQTTTGWVVFIGALAMMFGMLAVDIASLKEFSEMATPMFVGTTIGHVAAVLTAFVGGKIIPEQRDSTFTRAGDK